jgi:uncharacterized protein YqgV (UPF0045/DUF77 family)
VQVGRSSGFPNRTDAVFTRTEGEWDDVVDMLKRAVNAAEPEVASRVSVVLKADIPSRRERWADPQVRVA